MKQTNSKGKSRNDDTLNLAGEEGVGDNDTSNDHLDDGELGDGGNRETILDILSFGSGSGSIHFGALAVSGHFYYLLRK